MGDWLGLVQALAPLVAAGLCALVPTDHVRSLIAPTAAVAHLGLTLFSLFGPSRPSVGMLGFDAAAAPVLLVVSLLFVACTVYDIGYLGATRHEGRAASARIFYSCQLALVAALTVVIWSQHLGLTWVAMEASALCIAPLLYFHKTAHSIEATWKYLLVSSVGIALALLGSFFLAYASLHSGSVASLRFDDLVAQAPTLSAPWVHAAWVLLLVGYGTKMGLAPLHTWKPDAYGEAPGVVGAMLAGGVTAGAFLVLARVHRVVVAAGIGDQADRLLILIGVVSMAVAAAFLIQQRDLKRMLAYSSVEHMGILALGLGAGGIAATGAMLHVVNNGLLKGLMFMTVGNVQRAYGTKRVDGEVIGETRHPGIQGLLRKRPITGMLFLFGFFAVTGSPPFGLFLSELAIAYGLYAADRPVVLGLYLALLVVIFIGMGRTVLHVVQGVPAALPHDEAHEHRTRDTVTTVGPALVLLALVLLVGLGLCPPVLRLAEAAAEGLAP